MNSLYFRLAYWLGKTSWDSGITPPEVVEAFQSGTIPNGAALDLGCGTGTNVIYMARQGRSVTGIDFVPRALALARHKAQAAGVAEQVRFLQADVTHLERLDLPRCSYALDIGCFHSLNPDSRQRYGQGLASILVPGGWFMLYALEPQESGRPGFGATEEQVRSLFERWFALERVEKGEFAGRASNWYWMKKMKG